MVLFQVTHVKKISESWLKVCISMDGILPNLLFCLLRKSSEHGASREFANKSLFFGIFEYTVTEFNDN